MRQIPRTGRIGLIALVCLWGAVVASAQAVQETVLPNGLRVLIKEVHAAPVVTVDMWYKVGSRNERQGITGASHLLEHMTYKGTRDFAKNEMRTLVKHQGAIDNGATFYDFTHYYTTIASDRVALPIRLEASRMHAALLRQADLDSERVVVRSELEGRENNPNSLLFNDLMATAFKVHPYRWPVVGWRPDIERTTAKELHAYYRTYYVPNNATLVIVGDVAATPTLALVRKEFSRIPRAADPPQWVTPEPEQRGERRVVLRRQGRIPVAYLGWPLPGIAHDDIPALMLLEQVMGSGRLSRFYQSIVETQQGVSAWASSMLLRDAGLFIAGGAASPGQSLTPIEETTLQEIARIKETPPTTEEMTRARRQMAASLVFSRDSVTQQAEQLGFYATLTGDWAFLDKLPARLQAVTPEDVSRVARTYLIDDHRTTAIFQPTTATAPPVPVAALPVRATPAGYRQTDPLPAARAAAPAPAAAPVNAPVVRARIALPNGLVLIVQENHANPSVAVRAVLRAGKAYDPPGKAGLADLVANLLDRGTTTRSSTDIARELEGAGAELSTGTGRESVSLFGKALSDDLELIVRNVADMLRHPAFPEEELSKMRGQMLAGLAMERDAPGEIALRQFYRASLPAGHPYRPVTLDEEQAGLTALTRADCLAFQQARYSPRTAIISVVGDVRVEDVRRLVTQYFGEWTGEMPPLLTVAPVQPLPEAQQLVTRLPEKSQVDIYVGHAGNLSRSAPDYPAAQIMNMILGGGGALNSRLGDSIRDQKGLTYSIYSAFHASTGGGPWYAYLGTNPANADQAIVLLRQELMRMRTDGVTQQEVGDAIAFLTGAHAIALETNSAMTNALIDTEYFQLGLDYPERMRDQYRAVTRAQVNAAARTYLHPDRLIISIAGPYGAP